MNRRTKHLKICPQCDRIHPSDCARVFGSRFAPGPKKYVAQFPGATPRDTRGEAEADYCRYRLEGDK